RRRHTRSDRDWSSDVCSSDLHELWQTRLEQTRYTVARTAGYSMASPLRTFAAGTSCLAEVYDHNWLAVGDAAACRDPLSSGGIRSEERRVGKEGGWRWTLRGS